MTAKTPTRLRFLALALVVLDACKRASPAPATPPASDPASATGPIAAPPPPVAVSNTDAGNAPNSPPAASDAGAVATADAGSVVHLRWTERDVTPAGGSDPRTDVTVELTGPVTARFPLGVVEATCNDGSDSLDSTTPNILARLSCYYAGYGEYVDVVRDRAGIRVERYGQAEALPGNDNPRHEHVRVLGRYATPPGVTVVVDEPPSDAGAK